VADDTVVDAPVLDEEQDDEAQRVGLDETDLTDGGGDKPQTDREDKPDEPGAEETTEEQPETPDLPWDPARQTKDQAFANLRKTVDKQSELLTGLTETVKEQNAMLAAVRRGEKPIDTVDGMLDQLESMGGLSEFDADDVEAVAKYEKKKQRLLSRLRTARKAETEAALAGTRKPEPDTGLTATETIAAAKKDDPADPEPDDDKAFSQDDWKALLADADKRYGAEYRRAAAHAAVKELSGMGFGDGNVPSKPLVRELLFRLYAERKAEAAGKATAGKIRAKKPAKDAPGPSGPDPFGPDDLSAEVDRKPEYQPVTVDGLAEKIKARRAR